MAAHPGPAGQKRWRPPPFHRFRQVAADIWIADRPLAAVMALAADDANNTSEETRKLYAVWRKRAHQAPSSFQAFEGALKRLTCCPEHNTDGVQLGTLPERAWRKDTKAQTHAQYHPPATEIRSPPGITLKPDGESPVGRSRVSAPGSAPNPASRSAPSSAPGSAPGSAPAPGFNPRGRSDPPLESSPRSAAQK